jgi:hypothetical protein
MVTMARGHQEIARVGRVAVRARRSIAGRALVTQLEVRDEHKCSQNPKNAEKYEAGSPENAPG